MHECLHKYIEALKLTHDDGVCTIYDINGRYIWCSQKYLKLCKLCEYEDFKDLANPLWAALGAALKRMLATKHDMQNTINYVYGVAEDPKVVLVNYKFIKDPVNQDAIGSIVELQILDMNLLKQIGYAMNEVINHGIQSFLVMSNE